MGTAMCYAPGCQGLSLELASLGLAANQVLRCLRDVIVQLCSLSATLGQLPVVSSREYQGLPVMCGSTCRRTCACAPSGRRQASCRLCQAQKHHLTYLTWWAPAGGRPAPVHFPAADQTAAGVYFAHGQELCARGQRTGRGRTAAQGSRVALIHGHTGDFGSSALFVGAC